MNYQYFEMSRPLLQISFEVDPERSFPFADRLIPEARPHGFDINDDHRTMVRDLREIKLILHFIGLQ